MSPPIAQVVSRKSASGKGFGRKTRGAKEKNTDAVMEKHATPTAEPSVVTGLLVPEIRR